MGHKLTQSDIEKMKEEIRHRKLVVRQELLEHVKTARAFGDLSENFEYKAAKREKNRNESRIRYLEKMVRNAQTVSEEEDMDKIGLNKTVTMFIEDDEDEEVISLVTTVHVDMIKNRVSIESPIGKALNGHKVGERVFIPLENGRGYYVEIRKIEKFSEDIPLNIF